MSKESKRNKVGEFVTGLGEKAVNFKNNASPKINEAVGAISKGTANVAVKAKDGVIQSKTAVLDKMDVNGDGNVDIEDIIILGLRTPGVRINRTDFLIKELSRKNHEKIVELAIEKNPALAGISIEEIDHIVDEVIKYERNCVTGISAALGAPGGVAMAATIPADIVQYYGYMLRAAQKILYLYGFPEINTEENNQTFDTETLNVLILCMGVMYGVAGANNAIKGLAKALAKGVEKQLMNKALTKGTIYPIVKSVSKWFGVKMTKDVFAGFFKKSIPIIGGFIGGTLTFITFKPCCLKLKDSLRDTNLTNPKQVSIKDDNIIDAIAEDIITESELDEETLKVVLEDEE